MLPRQLGFLVHVITYGFFFTWRTPFTFQNMAEKQQKGTEAAEATKNIQNEAFKQKMSF